MNAITLRAPVNTGNRFCGPAAISAITGIGTAEAATVIRSITGQKAVKGTSNWGCCRALGKLGYDTKQIQAKHPNGKTLTLAGWLKTYKHLRTEGRVFLIAAGHHWQVISGRRYVCGIVKEVVSVRHEKVKRRAHVANVFEVIKAGRPTFDFDALKKKVVVDSRIASARRKAQIIAKQYGIELEKHWNAPDPGQPAEYWVHQPEWLTEETDPYAGDHLETGWPEILERVEAYAKLKQEGKDNADV